MEDNRHCQEDQQLSWGPRTNYYDQLKAVAQTILLQLCKVIPMLGVY